MAPKKTPAGKASTSSKTFVEFMRSIKFRQRSKQTDTAHCDSPFAQLKSPVDTRRQHFTSEDFQLIRSAN